VRETGEVVGKVCVGVGDAGAGVGEAGTGVGEVGVGVGEGMGGVGEGVMGDGVRIEETDGEHKSRAGFEVRPAAFVAVGEGTGEGE
jgi:hypothetical protein